MIWSTRGNECSLIDTYQKHIHSNVNGCRIIGQSTYRPQGRRSRIWRRIETHTTTNQSQYGQAWKDRTDWLRKAVSRELRRIRSSGWRCSGRESGDSALYRWWLHLGIVWLRIIPFEADLGPILITKVV